MEHDSFYFPKFKILEDRWLEVSSVVYLAMKPRPRTSDHLGRSCNDGSSRSKNGGVAASRPQWNDSIFHRPESLSGNRSHNAVVDRTKPSNITKIKSKTVVNVDRDCDLMNSSASTSSVQSSASCSPISPPYFEKHATEGDNYYIKFHLLTAEQVSNKDALKSSRSLAAEMGKISEEIMNPNATRYSLTHFHNHLLAQHNSVTIVE